MIYFNILNKTGNYKIIVYLNDIIDLNQIGIMMESFAIIWGICLGSLGAVICFFLLGIPISFFLENIIGNDASMIIGMVIGFIIGFSYAYDDVIKSQQ